MNYTLFSFLHSFANKNNIFDTSMRIIGGPLSYVVLPLFIGVYFLTLQTKRMYWFSLFFVTVLLSWFVTHTLKVLFHIPRPEFQYSNLVSALSSPGGYSFPSEHASVYAALASIFMYHNPKLGLVFSCVAVVIGISRVIAGVHTPLDVIFGWGVGVGVGLLCIFFFKKFL